MSSDLKDINMVTITIDKRTLDVKTYLLSIVALSYSIIALSNDNNPFPIEVPFTIDIKTFKIANLLSMLKIIDETYNILADKFPEGDTECVKLIYSLHEKKEEIILKLAELTKDGTAIKEETKASNDYMDILNNMKSTGRAH